MIPTTYYLISKSIGYYYSDLTFVSARNIPGVLEITLLKRLPMDAGAR